MYPLVEIGCYYGNKISTVALFFHLSKLCTLLSFVSHFWFFLVVVCEVLPSALERGA